MDAPPQIHSTLFQCDALQIRGMHSNVRRMVRQFVTQASHPGAFQAAHLWQSAATQIQLTVTVSPCLSTRCEPPMLVCWWPGPLLSFQQKRAVFDKDNSAFVPWHTGRGPRGLKVFRALLSCADALAGTICSDQNLNFSDRLPLLDSRFRRPKANPNMSCPWCLESICGRTKSSAGKHRHIPYRDRRTSWINDLSMWMHSQILRA